MNRVANSRNEQQYRDAADAIIQNISASPAVNRQEAEEPEKDNHE